MADNINAFLGAGVQLAQYARRGSGGLSRGSANLQTTDTGTVSGMARLVGVNAVPSQVPDTNKVPVQGDDIELAKFQFDSGSPEFTLAGAVLDQNFMAAATGRPIYAPGSGPWDMIGIRNDQIVFNDLIMLFSQQGNSQESGNVGASGFNHLLVLNAQVKPLGMNQMNYQAASLAQYGAVVNFSDVTPWGEGIDDTVFGGSKENALWFHTTYPFTICTVIGDGTTTAIVLPVAPIDVAHTLAFDQDGSALTVSSVTPATKTVTLSAAITSGHIAQILLETPSIPI